MSAQECHEGVTRKGEFQPCNKTAVALRYDPTKGGIYPVCVKHTRSPMRAMQTDEYAAYQRERTDA